MAAHVDDMLTRGKRCEAVKFWDKIKNKFALKSYDVVDYENPLVYVGMRIGKMRAYLIPGLFQKNL